MAGRPHLIDLEQQDIAVAVDPGFDKVLVPELNTGQLLSLVRDKFLVDAVGYNKVEGLPILAEELEQAILEVLGADE